MSRALFVLAVLVGCFLATTGYAEGNSCPTHRSMTHFRAVHCENECDNCSIPVDYQCPQCVKFCWQQPCGKKKFLWLIPYECSEWLPEGRPLFRPFVADPRQVTFSVGWRLNDQVLTKYVIDVSYPGEFPLIRWYGVWPGNAMMQFGVEGALWAVFDPLHFDAPLINADYYVGLPLTYAFGNWSFRLRGYHISSHVGDEFLMDHPGFDRRNPSAEYLDFFASYCLTPEVRVYGGVGWIARQDESYELGQWYLEAGTEARFPRCGVASFSDQIYAIPFFGMHFHFNNYYNRHINQTYVIGYEFGKCSGLCRRARIFFEYHDGYSVEGQFRCYPTNYFGLRMTYGF